MARFPASDSCQFVDLQIWEDLKHAIAGSSGFQSWQQEQLSLNPQSQHISLDLQVRKYLREALETLAY